MRRGPPTKLRSGPDAAGPSGDVTAALLTGDLRRARAAGPPVVLLGTQVRDWNCRFPDKTLCRGLTAIILRRSEFQTAGYGPPSLFEGSVVEDAAFHATGDGHDLAGDVARKLVRGERDHDSSDVVGLSHLPQRHRSRDPPEGLLVERGPCHRGLRPAGGHCVHARARGDPHHLVLEAQQEALHDGRLGRGVVGVPGLAEELPRSSRRARGCRDPLRSTPRRKPRAVRKVAVRFARNVASQRSSGSCQTGTSSSGQTPATAAQTSSSPAASKSRSVSASSVRSAAIARAPRAPPPELRPAPGRGGSGRRPRSPRRRKRGRRPSRSPEAPVTSTRLPWSPLSTNERLQA